MLNPLNEQDIINNFMSGNLKGIVTNGDYAYLPLRLTGLGITERIDKDGKARLLNRKNELFTTKELMENYANIPVLLGHPKNDLGDNIRAGLESDSTDFIGNTIHSYFNETLNEIWVIARIHNKEVLDLIGENELSTSPHFISSEVLEDKESEIYLEIPKGINSLAIVSSGFWDKKSQAPAIDKSDFTFLKGETMEEEKVDSIQTEEASTENPKDDKIDASEEELSKEVANLKEHEAKEAESFEELAKQHENLDKGDSMPEEIKKEEEIKETIDSESCEKTDEEVAEIKEEKEDVIDSDYIQDDNWTSEDDVREEVLEVITDIVDSAPSELAVKKIYAHNKRFKPSVLIKKFANANKHLVSSKYAGMIDKVDSSTLEIGKDIIEDIKKSVKAKSVSNKQSNEYCITKPDGSKSFSLI